MGLVDQEFLFFNFMLATILHLFPHAGAHPYASIALAFENAKLWLYITAPKCALVVLIWGFCVAWTRGEGTSVGTITEPTFLIAIVAYKGVP